MVDYEYVGELNSKHPKKATFYPSFLTGVLATAAFINDTTIRNIVNISAPLLTYMVTVAGKSSLHFIECKRGVTVLQDLINDLELEKNGTTSQKRRKEIDAQIIKLRTDLQKAKKDTITVVVF